MRHLSEIISEPKPNLISCAWGGYLAISPKNYSLKIGVTGKTQTEAASNFKLSFMAWAKLLLMDYEADGSGI